MAKNVKRIGKRAEERVRKVFLKEWKLPSDCVVRNIASGNYQVEFGDLTFRNFEREGYITPHLVVEVKRRKFIAKDLENSVVIRAFLNQIKQEVEKYTQVVGIEPTWLLVLVKPYERDFVVFYHLSEGSNLKIAPDFPKKGITTLKTFLKNVTPKKVSDF